MPVENVLKALASLTKDELGRVIAQARFLKDGTKPTTIKETRPVPQLVRVVFGYLNKYIYVPKSFNDKEFERLLNIAEEIEWLTKKLDLDKPKVHKLCRILVEAAVAELREQGQSLSFQTIINMKLSDPKSLLNNAFPGYDDNLLKRFVLNANTLQANSRQRIDLNIL